MVRISRIAGIVALAAAGLAVAAGLARAQQPPAGAPDAVPPVPPGEAFPAGTFVNLNDAGGPPKIDLAGVLGKKPVIFCYWIANLARSERIFTDLQQIVEEAGPGKVALYGIAKPFGGSTDTMPIKARIQALKIQVPVLLDDSFRLGQQLLVATVPSVAIVDKDGRLRLTNGASLVQQIEYKMDLRDAVARVAATGKLGTYGMLPRYDPVVEMIGKKAPDFEAACIDDGETRKWSALAAPNKVNLLVFWAVTCPHCQKEMPKLNEWLKDHGDGINVISAARVDNDAMKTKTQEFCKAAGFTFQTYADPTFRIADQFNVNATPTMLVIRPDGVIDSIVPPGEDAFGAFLEAKKKSLLKKS